MPLHRLQILVPAAGEVDQDVERSIGIARNAQRLGDGVRTLERGQDSLGAGQDCEGFERAVVGASDVIDPAK